MSTITRVYSKKFSQIKNFQDEKVIHYGIIESSTDMYGIHIFVETATSVCEDSESSIFDCKQDALDFVTYLYENAVQIESWRDIAYDLLEQVVFTAC